MTEPSQKVGDFLDILAYRLPVIKKAEAEIDRHLARQFCLFDYIKPDEMGLSKIIHDLLDSKGAHGQGDVFFQSFIEIFINPYLDRLPMSVIPHSPCRIFLEEITSTLKRNRRIDVVVKYNCFVVP